MSFTREDSERLIALCDADDEGCELTAAEYEELRDLLDRENAQFASRNPIH